MKRLFLLLILYSSGDIVAQNQNVPKTEGHWKRVGGQIVSEIPFLGIYSSPNMVKNPAIISSLYHLSISPRHK